MDKGGERRGETDLWGRSSRREERRERGRGTDRQMETEWEGEPLSRIKTEMRLSVIIETMTWQYQAGSGPQSQPHPVVVERTPDGQREGQEISPPEA